jgi:hypothetical protein
MIVECSVCDAKVDAKVLAEHLYPSTEYSEPYKHIFLVCPSCETAIVGGCEEVEIGDGETGWTNPIRLWPDPPSNLDNSLPYAVRRALEDARKCYRAKVFSACAVMCGKAIEAICREKTGEKTLQKGLKKLKDKGLIETRLYDWGEALRKERNIGAHATDEMTSAKDAEDVLDFATAFAEYVYVLSEKYETFANRKKKKP